MTTYNRIISGLLACLLGFVLSNQVSADELILSRFMAPGPGIKNIYAGTDGIRLELTGLSDDKDTLEIQEKTIFPEELLPPNAPKTSTEIYKLVLQKDKLLRKSQRGEEVIMQYSGYQEPEEWKIKSKEVRRSSEGHTKSRSLESACKIIEKGKKVVFGKEINTVTTKCVTKGSSSSIARIEMYGEGVGLVERSIRSISHDDTSSIEIHRFTLESVQEVKRLTQ